MERMMGKVRRVVISLLCILMLTSHFTPVMSSDAMDETKAFETQVQEVEEDDVQDIEHEDSQEVEEDDVQDIEHEDSQEVEEDDVQDIEHEDSQEVEEDDVQDIEHEDIDNEMVIERNNTGPVSTTGHPLQFGREYRMYNIGRGREAGSAYIESTNATWWSLRSNPPGEGIRFSRPGVTNPSQDFGTISFDVPLVISQRFQWTVTVPPSTPWEPPTTIPFTANVAMQRGANNRIGTNNVNDASTFIFAIGSENGVAIQSGVHDWLTAINNEDLYLHDTDRFDDFANWEFVPVVTRNLTVLPISEGGSASVERNVLEPGQITNLTANPDPGYRFVRWAILVPGGGSIGSTTNAQTTFTMGSQLAILLVEFEPNTDPLTNPLTVTHTEGGTLAGGDNQIFELAEGIVHRLPSLATIATHHRFARWEFVGDTNGATLQNATNVAAATVTMGTGPATVRAVFESTIPRHPLTITHTDRGTISGGSQTVEIEQGTVHDLPIARPTTHHRFVRWEFVGDANGAILQNATSQDNATLTMGTGPASVQAVFEHITHEVTIRAKANGTIEGAPTEQSSRSDVTFHLKQGMNYYLPVAVANEGHRFSYWQLLGEGHEAVISDVNNPINAVLTMGTSSLEIEAIFEQAIITLEEVDDLNFGTIPAHPHLVTIPREDEWRMRLNDARLIQSALEVQVAVNDPLQNDLGHELPEGALVFKASEGDYRPLSKEQLVVHTIEAVEGHNAEVTSRTITWATNEGILLRLNPLIDATASAYKGTVIWTLVDAP